MAVNEQVPDACPHLGSTKERDSRVLLQQSFLEWLDTTVVHHAQSVGLTSIEVVGCLQLFTADYVDASEDDDEDEDDDEEETPEWSPPRGPLAMNNS